MSIAMVLLAAGLGRRFGGPKQLEPIGPEGQPLFVLTAFAALDAGLAPVVVVTRRELRERTESEVGRWLDGRAVDVALQDAGGPPRERPWGTAHAVVVGAPGGTPVVVANADDWYGVDAIGALAARVAAGLGHDEVVVMGYRLADTLSAYGGVNRAILELDAHGSVVRMAEAIGLERRSGAVVDQAGVSYAGDAPVSMNLMAMGAGVVDRLRARFAGFAEDHAGDEAEMVLPGELGSLLESGCIEVVCLPTAARWAGMTRRDDVDDVRRAVAADLAADLAGDASESRSSAHPNRF